MINDQHHYLVTDREPKRQPVLHLTVWTGQCRIYIKCNNLFFEAKVGTFIAQIQCRKTMYCVTVRHLYFLYDVRWRAFQWWLYYSNTSVT